MKYYFKICRTKKYSLSRNVSFKPKLVYRKGRFVLVLLTQRPLQETLLGRRIKLGVRTALLCNSLSFRGTRNLLLFPESFLLLAASFRELPICSRYRQDVFGNSRFVPAIGRRFSGTSESLSLPSGRFSGKNADRLHCLGGNRFLWEIKRVTVASTGSARQEWHKKHCSRAMDCCWNIFYCLQPQILLSTFYLLFWHF